MDGEQISYVLSLDEYTQPIFKGILMSDSEIVPQRFEFPALYILNTDVEEGSGKHWCVVYYYCDFYLKKLRIIAEFFDPFGLSPGMQGLDWVVSIRDFDELYYSNKTVQAIGSHACGAHCLYYALIRCRGYAFMDILKLYFNEYEKNDKMVTEFVEQFGKVYIKEKLR